MIEFLGVCVRGDDGMTLKAAAMYLVQCWVRIQIVSYVRRFNVSHLKASWEAL